MNTYVKRVWIALAATLLAPVSVAGCAVSDEVPQHGSSASPLAVSRDTVAEDIRAAVRKAGLEPGRGKTTSEPNGVKNASYVDWIAVLETRQAEQALPKMGAELERLGWRRDTEVDAPLSYEKADWILLGRSVTQTDGARLAPGESLLTVAVTDFGGK
ncbi:hypothetical protein ACQEVM_17370 [Streptomyces sp. CA-243310]|uniref:hypothetical protein n=1 Tax=Streptomyces sp. CA-243310 TaxID=3240056 RepID=UPI003D9107D9